MCWALLILLAGCGGKDDPAVGADTAVTTEASDPRFDPSTWPDTVGEGRSAAVFAPDSWDGETPMPLMVLLHGYTMDADSQDAYFQTTARAAIDPMVVLLPDGKTDLDGQRFWNAGPCCDIYGDGVNDVRFLTKLIDDAEAHFPIDPDRIYVLGYSNGGFMAHRLACELGDRISAIASLAGMPDDRSCAGGMPSVLHMHGTADETVPYDTLYWLGAEDTVALWSERGRCSSGEGGGPVDHVSTVGGDETTISRWDGCESGASIELWRQAGASHSPGFTPAFYDDLYGWLLSH